MPATYRIRVTPRALADLEAVFEHISRDSPQNAAAMIRAIIDAIDSLESLPYRLQRPARRQRQGTAGPLNAGETVPRPLSRRRTEEGGAHPARPSRGNAPAVNFLPRTVACRRLPLRRPPETTVYLSDARAAPAIA